MFRDFQPTTGITPSDIETIIDSDIGVVITVHTAMVWIALVPNSKKAKRMEEGGHNRAKCRVQISTPVKSGVVPGRTPQRAEMLAAEATPFMILLQ